MLLDARRVGQAASRGLSLLETVSVASEPEEIRLNGLIDLDDLKMLLDPGTARVAPPLAEETDLPRLRLSEEHLPDPQSVLAEARRSALLHDQRCGHKARAALAELGKTFGWPGRGGGDQQE